MPQGIHARSAAPCSAFVGAPRDDVVVDKTAQDRQPHAQPTARGHTNDLTRRDGSVVVLPGTGFGPPRVLTGGIEHARIDALPDDAHDAAQAVRALLDVAERERQRALTVLLLSYEASVALDARAPRHAHIRGHGPSAWVRTFATERPFDAERQWDVTQTAAPDGRAHELSLTPRAGMRAMHERRVASCITHIHDGTLYQANLAHPLVVDRATRDEAFSFFVARTRTNAPRFSAFVDDRDATLVSLSPECFLTFDFTARTVSAFPIKGTRPRGHNPVDDERLRAELLASDKDRAEHVMIVDLMRNDLSRVCTSGTVTVSSLMHVTSAPNVHHLESRVDGRMRDDVDLRTLLEATAPGGSITGAPKSTAMETIHALEGTARGPYTGNLVVMTPDGKGAASILIRTWIRASSGEGVLHVGGGIVADSDPRDEWEETLAKARAFGHVDDE
jgi:anthranilate/para-aminobenzoate synthase component I